MGTLEPGQTQDSLFQHWQTCELQTCESHHVLEVLTCLGVVGHHLHLLWHEKSKVRRHRRVPD